MDRTDHDAIARRAIEAWNAQDVDRVLACYTSDLRYRDPHTTSPIVGAEAMGRYLTRLFESWRMHWTVREVQPFGVDEGAAVLWTARLTPAGGDRSVEVDGMDLALLEGELVRRNEVYFDRSVLAPLVMAA